MKRLLFILVILLAMNRFSIAQIDTSTVDLLNELDNQSETQMKLLPDKMIFTQRMFWGENGLMRNFNKYKLSVNERQNELKLRSTMFGIHQALGMVTLAAMAGQIYIGTRVYNGQTNLGEWHEALATVVDVGYFSTAALALFAPPKMLDDGKEYSSIKVHRTLAIIHFSSMIATNVLAGLIENNPSLRPYHRAAAFTAFTSYTLAFFIIKF